MKVFPLIVGIAAMALASPLSATPRSEAPATTQVMIVGTMHFANPGLDYRSLAVDDVLAPMRQRQIAAIVGALARFSPTRRSVRTVSIASF